MKSITVGIYRILYKISGAKKVSFYVAIGYTSLLNLIMVYGLSLLLKDWLQSMRNILILFAFPYIAVTTVLMVYLCYKQASPLKSIAKEGKKSSNLIEIIVYSLLCILVLLYSKYNDKIF